jgi:Putative auto-transporter adhesin, head GIN domain
MNLSARSLLTVAVVVALGLAAGVLAFRSEAATPTFSGAPLPLALVNGKLVHATRIEEGLGEPAFLPRDTDGQFSSVSLEMDAQVIVKAGSSYSVQVSTERNLQKYVQAVRVGSSLMISTNGSYSTRHPVIVEITVPSLTELDLTGNGHAEIDGDFGHDMTLEAEGAWVITGRGHVESLTLNLSEKSTAALEHLNTLDIQLHGATSGSLAVSAGRAVTGELSGHPSMVVYGHPARRDIKVGQGGALRFAR